MDKNLFFEVIDQIYQEDRHREGHKDITVKATQEKVVECHVNCAYCKDQPESFKLVLGVFTTLRNKKSENRECESSDDPERQIIAKKLKTHVIDSH